MKELGQYLKKEREKQKLSLEDLASRTKIHIQKLQHIESGERAQLPAKVFCIGLIKSYARELNVDMERLNDLIDQAFQETKADVVELSTEPSPQRDHRNKDQDDQMVGLFKVPKIVMIAASGLLSLLLLFFIFQVIEKMNAYSKEEALPQEVFVAEDDSNTIKGAVENENIETADDKNADDESTVTGSKGSSMPTTEPIEPTLSAEKTKPPQKPTPPPKEVATSLSPMDMSEGDFSEDNFGGPPVTNNKDGTDVVSDNKLTLTALEPVRAEVVWSDGYVQVMLLKSNESKTLVFSQPITLRVNNGGAVQVSFNDAKKTVPGPFNKPIEIQYP